MKTTQIIDRVPEFHFVKTSGALGLYDLKLGDQYLAADLSGQAIFVSSSTGAQYVEQNGNAWITFLFSYDCEGVIMAVIACCTRSHQTDAVVVDTSLDHMLTDQSSFYRQDKSHIVRGLYYAWEPTEESHTLFGALERSQRLICHSYN